MEKKLYISPMVKVLKLSTEVGFLAGSGTEPGASINPRPENPDNTDEMAKGGGLFDEIDFFEGASYNDF